MTADQIAVNVHIEHYFPKGYDPDKEPWKSIKTFHKAAIEKATDPFREKVNALVSELDTIWHEGRAYEQKFGVKPIGVK